jgi:hypothetical protein
LTAEPAVVVAQECEETDCVPDILFEPRNNASGRHLTPNVAEAAQERRNSQHGAALRRAANVMASIRRRNPSLESDGRASSQNNMLLSSFRMAEQDPFERSMSMQNIMLKTD